ncbi:MAG: cation:dicarboxylase symporter family transporter, partial [Pseudohongiellaceae bacterium]
MDRAALTRNILIGMVLGILLGSILHGIGLSSDNPVKLYLVDGLFDIGGQVFVISLKLLVVPLVFVSLACGASNLGSGANMGRIGTKTVLLYLFTTAVAITMALTVARIVDPGVGIDMQAQANFTPPETPSLKQVVIDIFPSNPI